MSEDFFTDYNDGDTVWVKLGPSWWPGEVKDLNNIPPDEIEFKKTPLAVVKFFEEDTYEYVRNWANIYPYNCERKSEFIKKGMAAFRSKLPHMEKFPKDVTTAEVKEGGNPNILSDPAYRPEKKINYVQEVFGTPSPKKSLKDSHKKSRSFNKFSPRDAAHITHRRFLGLDDYKAYICIQYPGKDRIPGDSEDEEVIRINTEPEQEYNCHSCPYSTKRLEVMILHTKSHIQGVYVSSPRRKRPITGRSRKKESAKKRRPTFSDESSNDDTPEPPREKKRRTKGHSTPKKPIKKIVEEAKPKPPSDIRSDLLAEWEDSDDDLDSSVLCESLDTTEFSKLIRDEDSILETNSTLLDDKEPSIVESELPEIDIKESHKFLEDIEVQESESSKRDMKETRKSLRDKETQESEPSETDMKETRKSLRIKETQESEPSKTDTNETHKIPVDKETQESEPAKIDTKEARRPLMDKETQEAIKSCFDFDEDDEEEQSLIKTTVAEGRKIPRVIPPTEKRKSEILDDIIDLEEEDLNKDDILKESQSFNEKLINEDKEELENAFKDLMDTTSVPKLPEVENTLKPTQNFHCVKTIKFPDKPDESPKKDREKLATEVPINPKKRFVKSFEDFENQLQQDEIRRKELKEEESIKKKEEEGVAINKFQKGIESTSEKNKDYDQVFQEQESSFSQTRRSSSSQKTQPLTTKGKEIFSSSNKIKKDTKTYQTTDSSDEDNSGIDFSKLQTSIMSKIMEEAKITNESKNRIMAKMRKKRLSFRSESSLSINREVKEMFPQEPKSKEDTKIKNTTHTNKQKQKSMLHTDNDNETTNVPFKKSKWSQRITYTKKNQDVSKGKTNEHKQNISLPIKIDKKLVLKVTHQDVILPKRDLNVNIFLENDNESKLSSELHTKETEINKDEVSKESNLETPAVSLNALMNESLTIDEKDSEGKNRDINVVSQESDLETADFFLKDFTNEINEKDLDEKHPFLEPTKECHTEEKMPKDLLRETNSPELFEEDELPSVITEHKSPETPADETFIEAPTKDITNLTSDPAETELVQNNSTETFCEDKTQSESITDEQSNGTLKISSTESETLSEVNKENEEIENETTTPVDSEITIQEIQSDQSHFLSPVNDDEFSPTVGFSESISESITQTNKRKKGRRKSSRYSVRKKRKYNRESKDSVEDENTEDISNVETLEKSLVPSLLTEVEDDANEVNRLEDAIVDTINNMTEKSTFTNGDEHIADVASPRAPENTLDEYKVLHPIQDQLHNNNINQVEAVEEETIFEVTIEQESSKSNIDADPELNESFNVETDHFDMDQEGGKLEEGIVSRENAEISDLTVSQSLDKNTEEDIVTNRLESKNEVVSEEHVSKEEGIVTNYLESKDEDVSEEHISKEEGILTNQLESIDEVVSEEHISKEEGILTNQLESIDEVVSEEHISKEEYIVTNQLESKDEVVSEELISQEDIVTNQLESKDEVVSEEHISKEEDIATNQLESKDEVVFDELISQEEDIVTNQLESKDEVVSEEHISKEEDIVTNQLESKDEVVSEELISQEEDIVTNQLESKDEVVSEEHISKEEDIVTNQLESKDEVVSEELISQEEDIVTNQLESKDEASKEHISKEEDIVANQLESKDEVVSEEHISKEETIDVEKEVTEEFLTNKQIATELKNEAIGEVNVFNDPIKEVATEAIKEMETKENITEDLGTSEIMLKAEKEMVSEQHLVEHCVTEVQTAEMSEVKPEESLTEFQTEVKKYENTVSEQQQEVEVETKDKLELEPEERIIENKKYEKTASEQQHVTEVQTKEKIELEHEESIMEFQTADEKDKKPVSEEYLAKEYVATADNHDDTKPKETMIELKTEDTTDDIEIEYLHKLQMRTQKVISEERGTKFDVESELETFSKENVEDQKEIFENANKDDIIEQNEESEKEEVVEGAIMKDSCNTEHKTDIAEELDSQEHVGEKHKDTDEKEISPEQDTEAFLENTYGMKIGEEKVSEDECLPELSKVTEERLDAENILNQEQSINDEGIATKDLALFEESLHLVAIPSKKSEEMEVNLPSDISTNNDEITKTSTQTKLAMTPFKFPDFKDNIQTMDELTSDKTEEEPNENKFECRIDSRKSMGFNDISIDDEDEKLTDLVSDIVQKLSQDESEKNQEELDIESSGESKTKKSKLFDDDSGQIPNDSTSSNDSGDDFMNKVEDKISKNENEDDSGHSKEVEVLCASNSEDSFKFSIQTNLSNLSRSEEISAIALATLSEIKTDLECSDTSSNVSADVAPKADLNFPEKLSDTEMVAIEGNLTVMSEKDLADAQVEITTDKVISSKKPVMFSNFSMDFSDSTSDSGSLNDASNEATKFVDFDSKGTEFTSRAITKELKPKIAMKKVNAYDQCELLDILEGNIDLDKKIVEFQTATKTFSGDIMDFEECIPSQIVCTKQFKQDMDDEMKKKDKSSVMSTTSKLLERLTDAKSLDFKNDNPDSPVKNIKNQKIKAKPIILSEQIIKPSTSEAKKVSPSTNNIINDIEDVEAFVIHKDLKKSVEIDEPKVVPVKASRKSRIKPIGKAKILQQTIITPAGEILQPTSALLKKKIISSSIPVSNVQTRIPTDVSTAVTNSKTKTNTTVISNVKPDTTNQDDNIFDIFNMPIVLSDQILTPESIENMPIVIDSESSVNKSSQNVIGATTSKTPVSKVVTKVVSTATPTLISTRAPNLTIKHQKPRILQTFSNKTALASALPSLAKPGKYIIVSQGSSNMPQTKYQPKKAIMKRTLPASLGSKVISAPEATGNKIMVVTNQQGQQQRLLLTPAQQKVLGYQSPSGPKLAKTVIKTNVLPKNLLTPLTKIDAGPSKTPSILGQKLVMPSQLLTSATSTARTVKSVTKSKITPTGQKPVPTKTAKTILITNKHGQTIKKIATTEDDIDKQVAEQLEAIKASSGMQFGSQKSDIPNNKSINKTPVRKFFNKKQESKPKLTPVLARTDLTNPPPLISTSKKPFPTTLSDPKPLVQEDPKPQGERPLNQLVIQDALGNQTTITEGQILALPSETVDGQPQSYMLVTLDQSGNLTPLNNEALMSLDPNLGLGGDLSNMVLQIDQGALGAGNVDHPMPLAQPATVKLTNPGEELQAGTSKIDIPRARAPLALPVANDVPIIEQKVQQSLMVAPSEAAVNMESMVSNSNGEQGQQLIVTGDPIATQKFLESLTEGTTDLANIIANAEGKSILIQADGQQILINTNSDGQMLTNVAESTEGGGNPIFATQPNKNTDILAAALADTDVFTSQPKISSQLSPNNALYPMNVGNVLETSLTLSSPIMTPLEVPSTNSKKIPDDEADILTQVPKNVDLPITITDPNISQTVANQQVATLIANELHANLELGLGISETTISAVSTGLTSPGFSYSLPALDESDISHKPFNSSMPLLNDDVDESPQRDKSQDKDLEKSEDNLTSERFLEEESRFTLGGGMCSSLSEPPPEMFDIPDVNSYGEKNGNNIPLSLQSTPDPKDDDTTDVSMQAESSSEGSCEIPLQPKIVAKSVDLSEVSDM